MKKLQKLNGSLFKNLEAEKMKKVQGGRYAQDALGTYTGEGVKVTSGGGGCGCNDSSASDPESPAGDDGADN
jgi:hypothetical protein